MNIRRTSQKDNDIQETINSNEQQPSSSFKIIFIHYDYSDGREVSYCDALSSDKTIVTTHCLDFFSSDTDAADVIILKKNGEYISRKEVLENKSGYTTKHITPAHNLHKMFMGNSFNWQPNISQYH